ncbi:HNH endonuclease [Amycolatopsis sp. YIM 10]|uniref:HNH endonuclease n=1 Tax=Amycolatopsis sp. YIM 10 TaxID=2653857 RepID=UPI00129006B8|nr:HNH endonuclease [Amycolatopsis sp. YIM 10]QFU87867.1 hypothetical protein YIM_13405 [Amycolatopsis sp. YIM 10]QFU94820.1 hypothetical protein YIM_48475 [Amycolatopsis sp. YIM 10]
MSEAWAGGSTRAWRRTRLFVLNRDRWICGLCGFAIDPLLEHPHPMSASVHHIRGKKYGDDPAWLQAAHRKCNMDVGDPNNQPDPEPRPMTEW